MLFARAASSSVSWDPLRSRTDYLDGVYERDLEDARERLRAARRRVTERAALAALAGLGAAAALAVTPALAAALAVGAAVEAVLCAGGVLRRRELIARLALDAHAYVLEEVARYGRNTVAERERLAAWLREIVSDGRRPGSLYVPERVARYACELEALAGALGAPGAAVLPPSAVACRRLLTNAVESPLYNPRLPSDELAAALSRIGAGIEV